MCGICGVFDTSGETFVSRGTVKQMADTIAHRGPDDDGFYVCGSVGLGHRRLSIIDVAGGHQPMSNEDGSVWVAFNGEIYNFEELNRQYLSHGHTFHTRSDTETIVHLYEELGEECFAQFRGMFAIALWDARKRKLLLARDRVGKKPLYYSWDGRRIVFGSEIKALWPAGNISKEIDQQAVSDYFSYLYVPAPKSIYKAVRKLRPAHYLTVSASGIQEVSYWDLRFNEIEENVPEQEWCERFLSEYRASVRMRLVSDVPLGAFLSGGIDSSSVVAMMSTLQPPVTTCSIGFRENKYNESEQARNFAASLQARHHEYIVEPQAVDLVPKLAWHYDEPFADSSALPTYHVSRVAREQVTVALSGDGGDENFAGYGRYRMTLNEERMRGWIPSPLRQNIFGPLGRYYPKLGWAPRYMRFKSTFQSLSQELINGYFNGISCACPPDVRPRLFTSEFLSNLNGYESSQVLQDHAARCDSNDPLTRIQHADIGTYLSDDILTKVDRASMANSLEVRSPLLDHKLMELIARMPSGLKLRGGEGKYLLKKALGGLVPDSILYRRKQGFAMPVAEWFRGELKVFAHDVIFRSPDGVLNPVFLQRCWNDHQQGVRDWSALLWTVLMFRSWQDVDRAI